MIKAKTSTSWIENGNRYALSHLYIHVVVRSHKLIGPLLVKEDDAANRPVKAPRALPEFLQGSSISGHLAAKHQNAMLLAEQESVAAVEVPRHSMADMVDSEMTEEQRQDAFKAAYLAELERYNDENKDKDEFEVEVDHQGWEAEMNGEADDEELEDVEWEWCETEEGSAADAEVSVKGQSKRLGAIDDDDLQAMTDEEFLVRVTLLCWESTVY
jgi:hypothetical protein